MAKRTVNTVHLTRAADGRAFQLLDRYAAVCGLTMTAALKRLIRNAGPAMIAHERESTPLTAAGGSAGPQLKAVAQAADSVRGLEGAKV